MNDLSARHQHLLGMVTTIGGFVASFFQHSGGLAISSIALAELYVWATKRGRSDDLLVAIDRDMLADIAILDFNRECARRFGRLRADLIADGIGVDSVDLMIAAVAIEHDLTLVTHNTKHFAHIPGLRIEDWLE